MKRKRRKQKRRALLAIILVVLVLVSLPFVFALYGRHQMRKIPSMSFAEVLEYSTRDNEEARITVGVIENDRSTFTVYGENGRESAPEILPYEIGSLSKTFTAGCIMKAAREGRLDLEAGIDAYLSLPEKEHYPTILDLMTHSSGYKAWYFQAPMIGNFFTGRNSFCGISKDRLLQKVASVDIPDEEHPFVYSNFGYAVLGLLTEAVYGSEFPSIINHFIQDDLGLRNTCLPDGENGLPNGWEWQEGDAYQAAGAVISDIRDMLRYAEMLMEDSEFLDGCCEPLKEISSSPKDYELLDIRMDAIGAGWIFDRENGIIWHNGGTGHYNAYLGFHPESETAVVVLSNLPPHYRVPATVLGIKKLRELIG